MRHDSAKCALGSDGTKNWDEELSMYIVSGSVEDVKGRSCRGGVSDVSDAWQTGGPSGGGGANMCTTSAMLPAE